MAFDFKNNLGNLMKEAQKMQEKLQDAQAQLTELIVVGESGAGMVKVKMNGKHEVLKVDIHKSLEEEGMDVIGDLVAGAFNNANKKVEEQSKEFIQKLTQGIKLPTDLQGSNEE
jgi:DNA-binding YbaB/EbfC family protein